MGKMLLEIKNKYKDYASRLKQLISEFNAIANKLDYIRGSADNLAL